jgi:hypothetical protein
MYSRIRLWILFTLLSTTGVILAAVYFGQARPTVSMPNLASRESILQKAVQFARTRGSMSGPLRTATWFGPDEKVQACIELEHGGKKELQRLLDNDLVQPFMWAVRIFQEQNPSELIIFYSPQGNLAGFQKRIADFVPGAELSTEDARQLAEEVATRDWQILFRGYKLVHTSERKNVSGRIDHTFAYEFIQQQAPLTEKIIISVSGNQLTGVKRFLVAPENFLLRYKRLCSSRETLFLLGGSSVVMLYGLGGLLLALLTLPSVHSWPWKPAMAGGAFICVLHVLNRINGFQFEWMTYSPSKSFHSFYLAWLAQTTGIALAWTLAAFLTFLVTLALDRIAFPGHSTPCGIGVKRKLLDSATAGRLFGGYLGAGILLGYVVIFYFLASKWFYWWVPSRPSCSPNLSGTMFPWLQPLAMSLKAGIWEESLFRALPIAGAAILGKKFGRRGAWIGAALVIQAIIFGASHADYTSLPVYTRLVELFLPSIAYGLVYIRWGLLPVMTTHAVLDLVLMSLPLFGAGSRPESVSRMVLLLAAILPLAVVAAGAWRTRWKADAAGSNMAEA